MPKTSHKPKTKIKIAVNRKAPAKRTQTHKKANQNHNHEHFYDLFLEEIHDLYSAENQILPKLNKLIKSASSQDLREKLQAHYKETQGQLKRLEKIFHLLGEKTRSHHCKGMEGILKEGDEMVAQHPKSTLKDVAIIAAAQKVEHYEIAAYGTAKAHATQMNFKEIAKLLDDTLDEEASADKKLTKCAEGTFFFPGINQKALKNERATARV